MDRPPIILALETSCDETAAALLHGHGDNVTESVFSQVRTHAAYGGVVPEVASRSHLEVIPVVVANVLRESQTRLAEIDLFAATTGPGLAPALLVGASVGRGLAVGACKPFIAVNHLEAHLLSPFFGMAEIPPHIALIVSGGHTLLFDVTAHGRYELLGRTLDDAAGEAFDKVAKLLGLGYPGGVAIERLAKGGNPTAVEFPRGLVESPTCDFSFSGLKTAVRVFLEKDAGKVPIADICASFQEAVVDVLTRKLVKAAKSRRRTLATLSGGVSSNRALQERAGQALAKVGIALRLAPPNLRTDNAAMIAYAASLKGMNGFDPTEDIQPNFDPALFGDEGGWVSSG